MAGRYNRRAVRRSKPRPKYTWTGIQAPSAVVGAGGTVHEIWQYSHDTGPCTLYAVRGNVHLENANAANVVVGLKLVRCRTDDAGLMTDDIVAIDTDIADIKYADMLWQWYGPVYGTAVATADNSERSFDLFVKSRRRLTDEKSSISLVCNADIAGRAYITVNLRALVRLH